MAKNKLERFEELREMMNVIQPEHKDVFGVDYKLKSKWGKDFFGNDNPITLELGCGKGEYCIELARMYPEQNFIGIDLKGARIWNGAKQAVEEGLKNVAFVRIRIELIESLFAKDEISNIWITFPDPQMSKVRKRLTGTRYMKIYSNIMSKDGIINLKTDSHFMYSYTREMIKHNGLKEILTTDDLYSSYIEKKLPQVKTFYERQWLKRGMTIKYIKFSLNNKFDFEEPNIEIERDGYRSEKKYMQ